MASLAQLAFVSVPSSTPSVTLNLNQPGLVKVLADSFDLGAPSFNGAPYSVGADYGERTVSFRLQVTGTYAEAMAVTQLVSRQLTQPNPSQGNRNWLMFRWQPSSDPMFLQTFQSALDPLDWENSGVGIWELPVSVLCDGFIIGPPEDIASFTITNDPSAGTNRMMYTLPTIKGDVETPLLLAQTSGPGITVDPGSSVGYLSSYALGGGNSHTFLARSLTELTSGVDVGATVSGAGSNYIEGNYKSCSFTTTIINERLVGSFTTALTPMPGTFRVLMRVVAPAGLGTTSRDLQLVVKFRTDGSSSYTYLSDLTNTPIPINWVNGSDTAYLIDLGIGQLPTGSPVGPVGLAAAPTLGNAPYFSIGAGFVAGAAIALRFDELFLIPVATNYGTARNALVDFPTYSASLPNNVIVYDGINNQMRTLHDASGTAPFSGIPVPATAMMHKGALPVIQPGINNYLQFLYNATVVTGTTTFVGRYYPRYLHARPDAD